MYEYEIASIDAQISYLTALRQVYVNGKTGAVLDNQDGTFSYLPGEEPVNPPDDGEAV